MNKEEAKLAMLCGAKVRHKIHHTQVSIRQEGATYIMSMYPYSHTYSIDVFWNCFSHWSHDTGWSIVHD